MPRPLRIACAALVGSWTLAFAAAPARADAQPDCPDAPSKATKTDEKPVSPPPLQPWEVDSFPGLRADFGFHFIRATGSLDARRLDTSPAFEAGDMRFRGNGMLTGGALSITAVHTGGVRVGISAAFFGVGGVSLSHAPLPGLSFAMSQPWACEVELTGGYAWHLGRFMPFADFRLGVGFAAADVDVRSVETGKTITLGRRALAPVVAPRLGMQVHIAGPLAIEVSGSVSPLGVEMVSGSAGLVLRTR